ncbi:uncharacterized protein [Primulina huaijiensis]|uniref:uncharacterized protein n=1 Tax=Primulina huaijiensis TaxID=1492673 RepID=UPI003CC79395
MVNKRIQKLLQNTRGRSRTADISNRGLNGQNESQVVTPPHSPSETTNTELELQHNVEHSEEGSSQRSQNTRGRTVMRDLLQIRPVPHKLTPEVWETLCDYWKKNESTSKINRENAHKKRRIHAQGRINIPTLEDKFFQENGVKPTRIELLELSCRSKKKGGAPIDDEAIRHEALLNEAVKRHLQDMPEGTDPRQVHEKAFSEVFGPEHSGRVRCLGAGALPSQVFPEQYKLSHCQGYDTASDVTEKFKEMEEKIKDMEAREAAREAQWEKERKAKEAEQEARLQAEMETREAQRQFEMEQSMRRMQEQQFQNFTRIMKSMMVGTSGGSRGPETLPA